MSEKLNKFHVIVTLLLMLCVVLLSTIVFFIVRDDVSQSITGEDLGTGETEQIFGSPPPTSSMQELTPEEEAARRAQSETDNFAAILGEIKRQEGIDYSINAEINSGLYGFDSPLIITDPYGISPLTALIGFMTVEPVRISIHVEGVNELSDISYNLQNFNTIHHIPIYGLYENRVNSVTLTATNEAGIVVNVAEHQISTEALGVPYNNIIIKTQSNNSSAYAEGLNFTTQYIKSAFDLNGDFRWALSPSFLLGGTYQFTDGHFLFSAGATLMGDTAFVEINPLGKIFAAYYAPYGSHHHIETLGNGNFIVTGSEGETIQDFIFEVDISTGEIIHTIDYKSILQRTRTLPNMGEGQSRDWMHMNAAVFDAESNSLIVSSNAQSAVFKHDYETNQIAWIFSDPKAWANMYESYLLTPIGENFEYTYGQHLPYILPDLDSNPDTIDLMLFDNGRGRYLYDDDLLYAIQTEGAIPLEEYSRMVHYRIDEVNMTVEQIWQYGKEQGDELFSIWGGSALLLDNGNRLGLFSVSTRDIAIYYPHVLEVNAEGDIIWEAMLYTESATGQLGENRIERLPLYNNSANDLGIGEAVENYIPDEVWEKYGYMEVSE